jgi:hypothetical protein
MRVMQHDLIKTSYGRTISLQQELGSQVLQGNANMGCIPLGRKHKQLGATWKNQHVKYLMHIAISGPVFLKEI